MTDHRIQNEDNTVFAEANEAQVHLRAPKMDIVFGHETGPGETNTGQVFMELNGTVQKRNDDGTTFVENSCHNLYYSSVDHNIDVDNYILSSRDINIGHDNSHVTVRGNRGNLYFREFELDVDSGINIGISKDYLEVNVAGGSDTPLTIENEVLHIHQYWESLPDTAAINKGYVDNAIQVIRDELSTQNQALYNENQALKRAVQYFIDTYGVPGD